MGAKDLKQTRMTVRKDSSDSVLHFWFNLPAYCPFCTVLHVLGAEAVIKGQTDWFLLPLGIRSADGVLQ